MAQNVTIAGASYSDVPEIIVPKTGGGTASFIDVSDTTATADKILTGYGAYGADGEWMVGSASPSVDPNLQSKTATPSESAQTITPDSGYDGLSQVEVSAISSTYVGSGITRRSASSLSASGKTVSVPAGYYASAATKDVATTTHPNPTASIANSTGIVTASHTQAAGYVAAGTTTGTLQLTTQGAQTITPGTSNQTIAANRWLTGAQTISGSSNLVASNIKNGVTIFGVTGTFAGFTTSVAIVHVSAPTGSTVTLTKSSVTKTVTSANAHLNNADTTLRDYYFYLSSSEYGTWTAKATSGSNTVQKTVAVSAVRQYDVYLSFNLYLIQAGTVNTSITKSFSSTNGSLTSGASYATFSSGTGKAGYVMFTIPDVAKYATLVMDLYEAKGYSGGLQKVPHFGIYDTTPNSTSNPTNYLAYTQVFTPGASGQSYTVSANVFNLNVSSFEGQKYIVIANNTATNGTNYWQIKNFYLAI